MFREDFVYLGEFIQTVFNDVRFLEAFSWKSRIRFLRVNDAISP